MSTAILRGFSLKLATFPTFLFSCLLIMSVAFFVAADDSASGQNIFEDADQDGLSNDEEKLYGTDPQKKDSDSDGYMDGVEVESGYDPLKPAPGDKIVIGIDGTETTGARTDDSGENLTEQVSGEIASALQDSASGNQEVTMEDLNASVEKVLSGTSEDISLPEIDLKNIKIKKGPSDSLSEKKRQEIIKQDATEYLTVISYIFANNSPKTFSDKDEFGSMLNSAASESVLALAMGNMNQINQFAEKGDKMFREMNEVEVPEDMLDVHVKALSLAKYAAELKGEIKMDGTDPLGQIATFSKIQGLLGSVSALVEEANQKMTDLEIDVIPLEL